MQSRFHHTALLAGFLCCRALTSVSFCADEISVVDKGSPVEEAGTIPVEKRMAVYERFAEDIRELKFKKPVTYKAVRKDEIKALFDKELEEELPEEEFNNKVKAYVKMGLLESSEGIREMLLDVMSEQMVGFYDPDERVLFTVDGLGLDEQLDAIIYVHELTHALQDQHFDLDSLGLYDQRNDDRATAALSLVEGDATLVMSNYFLKHGRFSFRMLMQAMTMDSQKLADAPYVIRRGLMFPYEEGTEFVTRIHDLGGWEGVNRAFRKPPQSTEQILHPERYISQLDEPVKVKLPKLGRRLGKDWKLVEDNVLGELNTRILFRNYLGNWRSRKPSRGWDGDRFRVYRNSRDGSMIMLWSTVWDSGKDAGEFFDAYARLMPQKYPDTEFDERGEEDWMLWSSGGLSVFLGKTGARALTIEAPTQDLILTVLSRFRDFRELGADFTGGSE